jgi:hypothetical protein
LKVGDILICHTVVVVSRTYINSEKIRTTVNKLYKIIEINNEGFSLINDLYDCHFFSFDRYNEWFYSLKDMRRNKLKKIKAAI